MKVLIWLATFFVLAVIQTLCRYAGIFLGFIPTVLLYGIGIAIAHYLSNGGKAGNGMWQCAHCEQLNSQKVDICACGHSREWTFQQPGRKEDWKCAGCGRAHKASVAKCSCGYSKEWSLKQQVHKS